MRKVKKYFIPHKENDYLPHFFRLEVVAMTAIVLGGIFLFTLSISQTQFYANFLASVYPKALVSYANDARKDIQNEGALSMNPLLQKAAQLKAQDMVVKGYFSHNSPDGKTPWYWFDLAGYPFKYAGENLAINFQDSKEVSDAWLASPEHKANILNPKFTEIGIATAEGMYDGKKAIFVVQLFGTPARQQFTEDIKNRVKTVSKTPKVSGTSTVSIAIPEVNEKQVAGSFESRNENVGLLEKILASPRTSIGWFYLAAMAAIIAIIALIFLSAIVGFKRVHKSVWINGLILLLFIILILAANNYIHLVESAIV
ncbi:MAG: CAP domain-containing protein [bacterium]|nr:CAP domain-containing protein [bacterium]